MTGPVTNSAPRTLSWRVQLGVFLTVFFALWVGGSREPPWSDAKQLHSVAEGIVYRGAIDIPVATVNTRDGKFYALHPFLPSAVHLPGTVLQWAVGNYFPEAKAVGRALGSHLAPAALAAASTLMFARLCVWLGVSALGASLASLGLAFATMFTVYARSPYSEMTQAWAYLGLYGSVLRASREPAPRRFLALGAWAGLVVNAKNIFILALLGAAVYVVWRLWGRLGPRGLLRAAGLAALAGLPFVVMIAVYNHARSGSFTNTGYPVGRMADREFVENVFFGVWSLFFSLGKSLFLYCPPLAAAVVAFPRAIRWRTDWLWVLALTAVPVIGVYGRFVFWSGDWCWGPRYLLFLVAPLMVPVARLIDDLLAARRRLALAALGALGLVGVGVTCLGSAFYWDHFIRIAQVARLQWLGQPNRAGATSPDQGGACNPCFEDYFPQNHLPAFQPIAGHLWLLRHVPRGHGWEEAEADAPWKRYTTLKLDVIKGWYAWARVDWWKLDFVGPLETAGHVLLVVFSLGLGLGAALWTVGLRRGRGARGRPAGDAESPAADDRPAPTPARAPPPTPKPAP
jgi:hypothetical protein